MSSSPTVLVQRARQGDSECGAALSRTVYDRLRKLAHRLLVERPDFTLEPTALVHEAWMRMEGQDLRTPADRAYLYTVLAEMLERVLVDHLRRRQAGKRGGNRERLTLTDHPALTENSHVDFLDLHQALQELDGVDASAARIVRLRYFTGRTIAEAAELLETGEADVIREWRFARKWLERRLRELGRSQSS